MQLKRDWRLQDWQKTTRYIPLSKTTKVSLRINMFFLLPMKKAHHFPFLTQSKNNNGTKLKKSQTGHLSGTGNKMILTLGVESKIKSLTLIQLII